MYDEPTTRSRRRHPRRSIRTLTLLTIATAASATSFAATAHAEPLGAVTGTSITSPAPNAVVDADYSQVSFDEQVGELNVPTVRVTGTATTTGPGPHEVRVGVVIPLALFGTLLPLGPGETATVAEDGSFSADVPTPPINARIVAFPEDLQSSGPIEDAVLDGIGPYQAVPVLGGGSISGELPVVGEIPGSAPGLSLGIRGQRNGFAVIAPAGFASLGGAPITFGALGGVTSGAYGDVSGDVGLSFMGTGGISDQYNDARGGVMVDGVRGYLRDHIPVGSDELPASTSQRTVDQQTGGQTIVQTQPVYVAKDPTEYPDAVPPLEGGYRPSGLELQRTTVQDHDGRQVSVTDRFRSADGRAHKIDLLYAEGLNILPYNGRSPLGGGGGAPCGLIPCDLDEPFSGSSPQAATGPFSVVPPRGGSVSPLADPDELDEPTFPAFEMPAFRIPWETGGAWEPRSHADPLTAPSTPTSTVYTRLPSAARLIGSVLFGSGGGFTPPAITSTYGAITFGTRPDSGLFVSDPYTIGLLLGGRSTQFVARFVRDVPAGGDTTIAQVYSTGTTPAEVEALAAAAEQRLAPAAPPVPPSPAPIAPPAPPTTPAARKAPRSLSATSRLQRTKSGQVRLRFTGRLALPSGVSRSACRTGGTVSVQIKAGSNTISTRRVKLDRNCRYTVRVNFRSAKRFGKRTRLSVTVRWSGNPQLTAKAAKRFTVKVR